MLNLIMNEMGFATNSSFVYQGDFWSQPMGLFLTGTMFVCSCINIWYKGIDDNLFDRIFYSLMAITMLCAFIVGFTDGRPHNIIQTTLYLFCVRFVASIIIKVHRHRKTGVAQKTRCE